MEDANRILINFENDDCDPLRILLENKYNKHNVALRLIQAYFITNEMSWDLKRACDHSIFSKQTTTDSVSFFC